MKLIFERSQAGRRAGTIPRHPGLPRAEVPEELRRASPPWLPELAELEVLRHFTELSTRNFGIDTGFYPLGSCTMKHNPRVNERLVMLPGFRDLHPYQDARDAQGALELMWRLQEILVEVSGLDACSLQPAAGSQGELTGLMLMRAYFADRGEGEVRDTIVTADTAHGTNPASVTMAGYKLQKVRTDARGNLDIETAPSLESRLAEGAADQDRPLIVDLLECGFIDSVGLAALLQGAKPLQNGEANVAFVAPDGPVRKLLTLTAVDRTIPVFATVAEARAAVLDPG